MDLCLLFLKKGRDDRHKTPLSLVSDSSRHIVVGGGGVAVGGRRKRRHSNHERGGGGGDVARRSEALFRGEVRSRALESTIESVRNVSSLDDSDAKTNDNIDVYFKDALHKIVNESNANALDVALERDEFKIERDD